MTPHQPYICPTTPPRAMLPAPGHDTLSRPYAPSPKPRVDPWVKDDRSAVVRSPLRDRFDQHYARWKKQTRLLSSRLEIAMHPDYQKIIGMGPQVLPLIFQSFVEAYDHWHWALSAITDEDPVGEAVGNTRVERERWLAFARSRGYL